MQTELKIDPDRPNIVEVWSDQKMIATINGCDGPGVIISSEYAPLILAPSGSTISCDAGLTEVRFHVRKTLTDNALERIEEELTRVPYSELPYELNLAPNHFGHIKIAGYTHLPFEQQIVKWAESKGWQAAFLPDRYVISIRRTK